MLLPTRDGLPFILILGVLLLRTMTAVAMNAGIAPVKTGGGNTATNTTPKTDLDVVLVTGIPSIIELPNVLFGIPPPQCVDFAIVSVGRIAPQLHITLRRNRRRTPARIDRGQFT